MLSRAALENGERPLHSPAHLRGVASSMSPAPQARYVGGMQGHTYTRKARMEVAHSSTLSDAFVCKILAAAL